MSVRLQRNKAACLHLIPWQREGAFCHNTELHARYRDPSIWIPEKRTQQPHICERLFFILDFPDGPVALWGITDDRFVLPVQTAKFELSNWKTDSINRYQSRIKLRFWFPHNPGAGVNHPAINWQMQAPLLACTICFLNKPAKERKPVRFKEIGKGLQGKQVFWCQEKKAERGCKRWREQKNQRWRNVQMTGHRWLRNNGVKSVGAPTQETQGPRVETQGAGEA